MDEEEALGGSSPCRAGYKDTGRGSGLNWETGIDLYTLLILRIRQVTNKNLHKELSMFCGDLNGKEIHKRGDVYMYVYIHIYI